MATVEWTDERLNDAFDRLTAEMAELRADMKELRTELDARMTTFESHVRGDLRVFWPAFTAAYVTLMAAFVVTQL